MKRKESQISLWTLPLHTFGRPSPIKIMQDAIPKHPQTEWVLCSDDWQDIVTTYIPQLNDVSIEDNYGDISLKGIQDAYFKNFHPLNWKRSCQK